MPEPNIHAVDDPRSGSAEDGKWRHELRTAICDAAQLCRALGLTAADVPEVAWDASGPDQFPMRVPRSFVARMRHGDPQDPLLRQVLATATEAVQTSGFSEDPLEESRFASAGVLRKYQGRALLIATAACPVHCRYCFRRHFPYSEQLAARDRWRPALDKLRRSADVREVILSGGDPLSLSTARLGELIDALDKIDSIRTLRIHTRFPVVLPSRVTPSLMRLLRGSTKQIVVVLHCNHAQELDGSDVSDALAALRDCSSTVLNQAVLLRGVNDSARALSELSTALFDAGVLPYYLHLLDRVAGSAHFEVAQTRAIELIRSLRAELPGYLVPRLVWEQPGALSKTPLI